MTPASTFANIANEDNPKAIAQIRGNSDYPHLSGIVKFYETPYKGILISAEVFNLPGSSQDTNFYGMHIHEYGDCTPPFDKTGMHYNPFEQSHPQHAGDLPPLLNNQGYAYNLFFNAHLTIDECIEKSIVIHSKPDDFTSQPSGDSGDKIACGTIKAV